MLVYSLSVFEIYLIVSTRITIHSCSCDRIVTCISLLYSFMYFDLILCLMIRPLTNFFQLSNTLFSLFSSALFACISCSWFQASMPHFLITTFIPLIGM